MRRSLALCCQFAERLKIELSIARDAITSGCLFPNDDIENLVIPGPCVVKNRDINFKALKAQLTGQFCSHGFCTMEASAAQNLKYAHSVIFDQRWLKSKISP